jgi:hypothetical protein
MPTRKVVAVITDEMLQQELEEIRARLASKGIDLDQVIDAEPIEDFDQ